MTSAAVKPGAKAIARVSGEHKRVTIMGWSNDGFTVIVRVDSTGNQLYRMPRQLTLVVSEATP